MTGNSEQVYKCILKFREACNKICQKRDCTKEMFETNLDYVTYLDATGSPHSIRLSVNPLHSLSVIITHTPRISPVDYITYLLSCVSFWLGISPLSFMLQFKVKSVKLYVKHITGNNAGKGGKSEPNAQTSQTDMLIKQMSVELAALTTSQSMTDLKLMALVTALQTEGRRNTHVEDD